MDQHLFVVRNIIWALVAALGVVVSAAQPVQAAATCKVVPTWCPPAPGGSGGTESVPEPVTLGVLAMGAAAAFAVGRRRKR
jgi:PEP-CTERM motif